MASDPMLDDLRAAMEQQHDECPDHWSDCNRAKAFVRTHGPALLARLEAMEKAVAEEREACALRCVGMADSHYSTAISAAHRTPECLGWEAKVKAGKYGNPEHAAHQRMNEGFGAANALWEAAKAIRARGQS